MSAAGDQRAGSPLPAARSPSWPQAGFRPRIKARTRRVSHVSGQGRPLPRRGGPAAIVSGSADATYPGVRCRDPPTGTTDRCRRSRESPIDFFARSSAGVRRSSPPCRNAAGPPGSSPGVTSIVMTRVAGPFAAHGLRHHTPDREEAMDGKERGGRGAVVVCGADSGRSFWQPVPANCSIRRPWKRWCGCACRETSSLRSAPCCFRSSWRGSKSGRAGNSGLSDSGFSRVTVAVSCGA